MGSSGSTNPSNMICDAISAHGLHCTCCYGLLSTTLVHCCTLFLCYLGAVTQNQTNTEIQISIQRSSSWATNFCHPNHVTVFAHHNKFVDQEPSSKLCSDVSRAVLYYAICFYFSLLENNIGFLVLLILESHNNK